MDADLWMEILYPQIHVERKGTRACFFVRPSNGTSHKTKGVAYLDTSNCTPGQISTLWKAKESESAPMFDHQGVQVKNKISKV